MVDHLYIDVGDEQAMLTQALPPEPEIEFCSLDHVVELSSEFGDPFMLLSRVEEECGVPLCYLVFRRS